MENQLFLKVSFYQIAVCLILSVGTLCFNSGRLKISLNVPYPCKLSSAACTRYNLVFSWWLSVIIIYLFWLLWLVKVKEALTSGMDGGLKHVLTHLSLTLTSCPLRSWSLGTSVAMQRVPGQVPVIVGWLLFSHDNPWFHSTESHFLKLFFFSCFRSSFNIHISSFRVAIIFFSPFILVVSNGPCHSNTYLLVSSLISPGISTRYHGHLFACSGSSVFAQASRLFPRLCRRTRYAPCQGLSQGTLWRFYSSLHVFLMDYIKLLWDSYSS